MQNVYDIAHDLARSLKETDQFKDYVSLKNKIDQEPSLKAMMDDFQQKSMALQAQIMTGQEQDAELMAQVQSLYGIVMSDPAAAGFMQAQMALSQIVSDIYQIIGEAVNV